MLSYRVRKTNTTQKKKEEKKKKKLKNTHATHLPNATAPLHYKTALENHRSTSDTPSPPP